MKDRLTLKLTLITLSLLGLLASGVLTLDHIKIKSGADFTPVCDINPLLSCSSVMASDYAKFGELPLSVFGVAGFLALLFFSLAWLLGIRIWPKLWRLALTIAFAGLVFAHYLFVVAVAILGTICPWCSLVWAVTIAVFWVVAYINTKHSLLVAERLKWAEGLQIWFLKYHRAIFILWYLVIIVILILRFQEQLRFWLVGV